MENFLHKESVAQNILDNISDDFTAEQLSKGMAHKYFKREGAPGSYKYYYTEADYKAGKSSEGEDKNSISGYRKYLIEYGTKNNDKNLVDYAKTASDKQIEQRMKSDKYEEQYQDKKTQSNFKDIHIFTPKEGGLSIDATLNGQKVGPVKISKEDVNSFSDKTNRQELAKKYLSEEERRKEKESFKIGDKVKLYGYDKEGRVVVDEYTISKPGMRASGDRLKDNELYLTAPGEIGFDVSIDWLNKNAIRD